MSNTNWKEEFKEAFCLRHANGIDYTNTVIDWIESNLLATPLGEKFTMNDFEKGLMLAGLVKPNNEQEQKEFNLLQLIEALDACFGVMMQPYLIESEKAKEKAHRLGVSIHSETWSEARYKAEKMYYEAKSLLNQKEDNNVTPLDNVKAFCEQNKDSITRLVNQPLSGDNVTSNRQEEEEEIKSKIQDELLSLQTCSGVTKLSTGEADMLSESIYENVVKELCSQR
jgi:hypothetical protein